MTGEEACSIIRKAMNIDENKTFKCLEYSSGFVINTRPNEKDVIGSTFIVLKESGAIKSFNPTMIPMSERFTMKDLGEFPKKE